MFGERDDFVGAGLGREAVVAGIQVGALPGAGERDVGAFPGGVLSDDEVRGVAGVALGREGVLDVGEADIGGCNLSAVEDRVAAVAEPELEPARVHVAHPPERSVAYMPEVWMADCLAHLNLVAGVEVV